VLLSSGVGQWCASGPVDKQERRYLLRFEDAERGDVSFTEELQAGSMFARAEARGWNCHLFAHMPRDPKAASTAPDTSELQPST
jgi:hypothetical protein